MGIPIKIDTGLVKKDFQIEHTAQGLSPSGIDYMRISFYIAKDTVSSPHSSPHSGRIFTSHTSDRGLIFRTYKEL